jgi:hypothetical protein
MKLFKKNKFFLNYLLENLKISEDLSILQEFKALLSISIHILFNSTSNIIDFQSIDECNIFSDRFRLLYDDEFFNSIKMLYYMFNIQYNIPAFNANLLLPYQENKKFLDLSHKLYNSDSTDIVDWQKSEDFQLRQFYQYYFQLVNDYNYLENLNVNLIAKVNDLEVKLNHVNGSAIECGICPKLKESLQIVTEKYNNIVKNYSAFQAEKERMVMKYATSEKHVIEAQRYIFIFIINYV